jgi:hypothetical protein
MADQNAPIEPHGFSKLLFILTMVGTALWTGAVFLFVL